MVYREGVVESKGYEVAQNYYCKLCNVPISKTQPKFVVSSRELMGSSIKMQERVLCVKCYQGLSQTNINKIPYKRHSYRNSRRLYLHT